MISDPSPDLDALDLITDAERVLNPVWCEVFLAFMEMSHLPPERLLVWLQAILKAYPADPAKVDRRHPPSIEAIERWQGKMYSPAITQYRERQIAEIEKSSSLVCCISTSKIVLEVGEAECFLGTLIVAFERRSETLVHHIVRHALNAADVLHVAKKLVDRASKRISADRFDTSRYLLLPDLGSSHEWSQELRSFFRKNLPNGQTGTLNLSLPASFVLIDKSSAVEINLQGRRFTTRHDLWLPLEYSASNALHEISCADEQGDNVLHDVLAKASRNIRQALKKSAGPENPPPTWQGLSRARWRPDGQFKRESRENDLP